MIHIAAGLMILSLTMAALCAVSLLVPGAPDVSGTFVIGAAAAVGSSLALLLFVLRERL